MPTYIQLTRGAVAVIDARDLAKVSQYSWHLKVDSKTGKHYAYRSYRTGSKVGTQSMHAFLFPHLGQRDHINGDGLDNRSMNIRSCSHSENQANRKLNRNNKSGYKGVTFHGASGKWMAAIKVRGAKKYLGIFENPQLAAAAYDQAAREAFGDFCNVNRCEEQP